MTSKLFNLLIGTYATGTDNDIVVYRFNSHTSQLIEIGGIKGIENPSFICVSENGRFVYAVNEIDGDREGLVTALSFEQGSGRLTFINQQPVMGSAPCYIAVNQVQNHVFVANYASGSLSVLPLGNEGSVLPVTQTVKNEGGGPNQQRQEKPHVHSVVLSPDENFLLFTDLGTDELNFYHYKPFDATPLVPAGHCPLRVHPGHGPRHIEFTADKKFMYLITEMGACIYGYIYNGPQSGLQQTISIVDEGFEGAVGGADLHVSPDGRFLYASNRGDANEIVVLSIDVETGWLTFVERKPSMGKSPRNIALDPEGSYLLVANENSNDIYVYKIDKQTGRLTLTNSKINIGSPACLKFANTV